MRGVSVWSLVALLLIVSVTPATAEEVQYGEPYLAEATWADRAVCNVTVSGAAAVFCGNGNVWWFTFRNEPLHVLTHVVLEMKSEYPSVGDITYHWQFNGTNTPSMRCDLPCRIERPIDPALSHTAEPVQLYLHFGDADLALHPFLALGVRSGVGAFYNGFTVPEDYSPLA